MSIADAGGYYSGSYVENALQQIGAVIPTYAAQIIDARDYGVDFTQGIDGPDQGPAIQAALDAAAARVAVNLTGAVVQLPYGEGNLQTPLTVSQGVWLRGHGAGLTGIYATNWASNANPFITIDSTQQAARISDLSLFSNSGSATAHGIDIHGHAFESTGGDFTLVENVFIYINGGNGVMVESGAVECRLRNVYVRANNGAGFWITGTDNLLSNCTADTCGAAGFQGNTANTKFVNCKAFGCTGSGFNMANADRCMFSSCEAQDNHSYGFNDGGVGNVYTACVADTNGWSSSGLTPSTVYGFFINGYSIAVGCMATNRQQHFSAYPQTYGFGGHADGSGNTPTVIGTSHQPGTAHVDPAAAGRFFVNDYFLWSDVPTSDPLVAGQLWSNGGVLTVSAG